MTTRLFKLSLAGVLAATLLPVFGQIDPEPRKILHLGYNQSLKDDGPPGAYAFYYWNMPNVPTTNETLRLVIAPGYVDSELGFKGLLGENTDLAVGAFGGFYANNYNEVDGGDYKRGQSFEGHSAGASVSLYHLVNPGGRIPLSAILRGKVDEHMYRKSSDTADHFKIPDSQPFVYLRTGLRWGGKEPVIGPRLALELSGWYELQQRLSAENYGFNNDHDMESTAHKFWMRAQLNFTTPESRHYMVAGFMAGTTINPDRLSAFRIGGVMP